MGVLVQINLKRKLIEQLEGEILLYSCVVSIINASFN